MCFLVLFLGMRIPYVNLLSQSITQELSPLPPPWQLYSHSLNQQSLLKGTVSSQNHTYIYGFLFCFLKNALKQLHT